VVVANNERNHTLSEASRIRIVPAGTNTTVRVLMNHEMESGQRKDSSGKAIPAWHIQDVTVLLNGKPVLMAEWGTAVSKNPFWQFTLKGAKAGDKVAIQWKDNRGDSRTDEATVGPI
jgi:sulfur-oxidizing protein SoxZ